MLGILFNKNKRKWLSQLSENKSKTDMDFVIVNFLMKDNISIDQFIENQFANEIIENGNSLYVYEMASSLSVDPTKKKKLNPSPSFKKYFSNDYDRPMGLSDWFIIGYPDVAGYVIHNPHIFEEELKSREYEFLNADGKPNFKCYRYLIDKYKRNHTLELKIK